MLHTILKRERDQQSAYFPTDDIFLNFGSNSRLAVYSKLSVEDMLKKMWICLYINY